MAAEERPPDLMLYCVQRGGGGQTLAPPIVSPPSSNEAALGLLTVSGQLSRAGWCCPFTRSWRCIRLWSVSTGW